MRKRFLNVLAACLALGLAAPLAAQVGKPTPRPDDARGRAAALLEWFGGVASPEYLDRKAQVAERELARWEAKIPGTPAYRAAAARATGGAPAVAGTWVNIGPTDGTGQTSGTDPNTSDSGRPTVILPHPTIATRLYMGISGGGVWRCDNADVAAAGDWTWYPITDALPAGTPAGNLSVGGLAFKPEDSNTLYMALGDMEPGSADSTAEGRGFWISSDAGTTWARGGTLGATTRVKTLLGIPGNIVLVAGNNGLWRSVDSGLNFTQVTLPSNPSSVWDLLRLANGNLVATTTNPTRILTSTDSGATWTAATLDASVTALASYRISVAAAASQSTAVVGIADTNGGGDLAKGLLKSNDGGATWTYVAAASLFNANDAGQGWYNQLITVDPNNTQTIFAAANLSLYRSTDGGATWTRLSQWMGTDRVYIHADFHVSAWAKTGPKTLYIGNDGGIAVVRNPDLASVPTGSGYVPSVLTFVDPRRNRGLATHLIYHLGSTTATTPAGSVGRVTIGLQDMGTRYRSSSATTAYNLVVGGDGFGTLIHPTDGNKMVGSLYYAWILRTTDGSTWNYAYTGIAEAGGNAPFLTRISPGLADPTGNTLYTFTNPKVYKSTDWAATWTAMGTTGLPASGFNIRGVVSSPSNANAVAIVANAGRGYVTYNGGSSWGQVGSFPNNAQNMGSIAFDPTNDQVLYATSVAFSTTANHIWKSTNGGTSWTALDSASNGFPFGVPVHMVKVNPLSGNDLFAGTDLGLYRSTDGGANWTRYGTGLPLVSVRDIYVAPDATFLRVGTHGRGVWEVSLGSVSGPAIVTHPSNATVAAGGNTSFTVVATGATGYQWQLSTGGPFADITNGGVYSGATTATLSITGATTGMNGYQYRVVVSGAGPSVTSNAATLTVAWLTLTTPPASQTVNAGSTATFSVVVDANPAATYQWQVLPSGGGSWANVTTGTGGTTASYTTAATVPANNGNQYRVLVQNAAGSLTAGPATLTVNWLTITANPANLTVMAGATAGFSATVSANPAATYQWQVLPSGGAWGNVVGGTGANTTAYTTPPTTLADNGSQFRLVATNSVGTATSGAALLTVLSVPTFNLAFLDDAGRSKVCLNSTTGQFIWTDLTGPNAGRTYSGIAIVQSGPFGLLFTTPAGSSVRLSVNYESALRRARGSCSVGLSVMSFLTDSDTTVPKTVPCP
ncbi:MAG: hypothetical protein HY823_10955 [Acidobacteria bacterium]|nr:hypothetical protein [Acidobacteriota bacterium]